MEGCPVAPSAEVHERPPGIDDDGARDHGNVVIPLPRAASDRRIKPAPLPRHHLKPGAIVDQQRHKGRAIDVGPDILRIEALVGGAHLRLRFGRENVQGVVMVKACCEVRLFRVEVAEKLRRVFPQGFGNEGAELERQAMVAIV